MAVRWYVPSFSYPVTRPYPYKWFPWVVLIGGIFSLVLFSAINLAANGYALEVQYTADPNSTVSQAYWAEQWPFSWFSKVETICQSQTLPINSKFFTDKLSLSYTLTSVWQNRTTAENTFNVTMIPSLRYTNNVLENCAVDEIRISLKPDTDLYYSWGVEAEVYIMCSINNDDTPTWFNLTTTCFDYMGFNTLPPFLQIDHRTKASLWWGRYLLLSSTELLNKAVSSQVNHSIADHTEILVKSKIIASRGVIPPAQMVPISSPFFFWEANYPYCVANYSGILSRESECSVPHIGNRIEAEYNYLDQWPRILPQADQYAKVFYSTVLADLGSSSSNNLLTNASLLQEYTQNTNASEYIFRKLDDIDFMYAFDGLSYPPTYNELRDSMGPLEITPSTISAEYFCQVPQRKPIGPLLVAIFVADLVFLQAAYKLLTWTTTAWTERNNQEAKFCQGCLENMERGPYELSLTAPTHPALQESLPESSETWSKLTLRSIHRRHKSSGSQQSLVLSPGLSE